MRGASVWGSAITHYRMFFFFMLPQGATQMYSLCISNSLLFFFYKSHNRKGVWIFLGRWSSLPLPSPACRLPALQGLLYERNWRGRATAQVLRRSKYAGIVPPPPRDLNPTLLIQISSGQGTAEMSFLRGLNLTSACGVRSRLGTMRSWTQRRRGWAAAGRFTTATSWRSSCPVHTWASPRRLAH